MVVSRDEWWADCEAFPKKLLPSLGRNQGSQDELSRPGNNRHELATISISRWSYYVHLLSSPPEDKARI